MDKLIQRFFSGLPVSSLNFPSEALSLEGQMTLLNATVNSDLVLKQPLRYQYQKAFLKRLLNQLESLDLVVFEGLYSAYVRLVQMPHQLGSKSFNHYRVGSGGDVVTLIEDENLISQGTTGLRTWTGALALSEWCLNNKDLITNKTILELGSGVGLTGLVACRHCHPQRFCFSDGHPEVVKTLAENIKLNFPTASAVPSSKLRLDLEIDKTTRVSLMNLSWDNIDCTAIAALGKIDFVLAADVVYDPELFQHLLNALKMADGECNIFACTERNPDTLNLFLKEAVHSFRCIELSCPEQKNFTWEPVPLVRIFQFQRKSN
ncbi:protein-lysine N-methyltransferase EEF2KMT [Dendroctonus ponderosae]|uniref:FAM86 N-terminal domain-containing protein n=1 Tax=Dendroctonus ponderosae TaxID=77166 RepID=A0AAR5P4U3_DENPD|nr:protein-lysine N-methyltransferase EEF2KMT [Dendroctonus ponderosae]KAH1003896.1 hypothetical protein HUJ04_003735 [Dendroctonus ponderosae]KAH1010465.1 hypothetical protein HUJ05_004755 [Dendroctonus ponderosae]KAH1010466.1 hypothetical protein HUJ05_004755 [Dendroctonus ponderosae]